MSSRSFIMALAAALIIVVGVVGAALAHSIKIGALELTDLWTRATPPGAPTAGGFLTIGNSSAEADRLLGATSPVAGRVEIHQMTSTGGTMIMRPVEGGVEIPAGGTVDLAPGGFHIMFMDLNETFIEGGKVPVTLSFEKAGSVETFLHVLGIGARGAGDDHQHDTSEPGAGQ